MNRINTKLLFAEVCLLIASVLIWRSLWLLLDRVPFSQELFALVLMSILGLVMAIPAMRYIIKKGR
jgi:hypothetical protein